MTKYFVLPCMGDLTIEHQFYVLDGQPILFVCKNNENNRYLCSCCRLHEKWVVVQIDKAELIDLIDDKITIREIFETHGDTAILVTWNGTAFSVDSFASAEFFPKEGATLGLPYERIGSYYRSIKQELFLKEIFLTGGCK